jgi:hypothetical protein
MTYRLTNSRKSNFATEPTIDQLVQALARPAPDNREVQRLFGDPVTPAAALPLPATTPRPGPEPRRRPQCE